eukprot:3414587-Pyramimonas_sp.AAC.1
MLLTPELGIFANPLRTACRLRENQPQIHSALRSSRNSLPPPRLLFCLPSKRRAGRPSVRCRGFAHGVGPGTLNPILGIASSPCAVRAGPGALKPPSSAKAARHGHHEFSRDARGPGRGGAS